jgi:uncharacterized protein involved in exopolysaccharide biosynthesis/Mrp family chromosome partitioning ATPase
MPESKIELLPDADAGYGQLFALLLRRRFLVLSFLLTALLLAYISYISKKPMYRSEMQLLVEPNYQQEIENGGTQPSGGLTNSGTFQIDYATQIRLMQSTQLIERAVVSLRSQYPDISVDEIRESLSVTRVVETDDEVDTKILQVEYSSDDAQKTQRVLEEMQDVYLSYNLEQQELRLNQGLAFVDKQLPKVEGDVAEAEQALKEFRASQGLVNPEQRAEEIAKALDNIAQERRGIRAEYQDTQAKFNSLQRQLSRSPQNALVAARLSQSERYQTLLNQLQETELALAATRSTYTENAPPSRNLQRKLESQIALLQQEAQRVLGQVTSEQASSNLQQTRQVTSEQASSNLQQTGQVTSEQASSNLQQAGQLGQIDLELTSELATAQTALSGLRARDRSLSEAEGRLRGELNRYPQLIAEYTRLQPEIEVKRDTLQQLLQARQTLGIEIARGGYSWQVIELPQLGRRIGPNLRTDLLLGAIAGLFLGAIAAFIRDGSDDVIRTNDKLARTVALPILGTLPKLPRNITNFVAPLTERSNLGTGTASALQVNQWRRFRESLDLVYQNIQRFSIDTPLKSIVITSALPNEGKSAVSLGLALTAARLHQRVLLIDADLRSPSLHSQLNLPNEQGLATLLERQSAPRPYSLNSNGDQRLSEQRLTAVLETEQDLPRLHRFNANIDVLTTGRIPLDPVKLLSSQPAKAWIQTFENEYDLVILDASPLLGIVDAIRLASLCDGVLLVTRLNYITQAELLQAVSALGTSNIVGIVANGAEGMQGRSGNY